MANLTVEMRGHVAVVTLDRPPVNAVDNETLREIRDTFRAFEQERIVRSAIFTATGDRAFMGGVDLRSIGAKSDPDEQPAWLITDGGRLAREAMWAITDCAVPVIGAINGPAIGAGVAFAACCDILLASDNATFGCTEINVGLLGASAHLSLLVGRHKAREMFFTGELVPAAELHRIGAIRAVLPRRELLGEAIKLAETLASKSPIALRLAKESMNRVEDMALKDAYRTEQDYTHRLRGFEDSAEARNAFFEKRPPDFQWR